MNCFFADCEAEVVGCRRLESADVGSKYSLHLHFCDLHGRILIGFIYEEGKVVESALSSYGLNN